MLSTAQRMQRHRIKQQSKGEIYREEIAPLLHAGMTEEKMVLALADHTKGCGRTKRNKIYAVARRICGITQPETSNVQIIHTNGKGWAKIHGGNAAVALSAEECCGRELKPGRINI